MAKVEGCFMVVMVESLMDLSWRHPPPNRDGSKSGDLFNYDDHMFRNILFTHTLSSFSREFPKIYCRAANLAALLLMGMVFNAHGADLSEVDRALIAKAKATGAPVITVLYSGRPLVLGPALKASDAFVAAWLPGTEGEGMTDVLFGDTPFTGTLARNWPKSDEQLAGLSSTPHSLFKDGFGLKN
jgi:hypothetical protein